MKGNCATQCACYRYQRGIEKEGSNPSRTPATPAKGACQINNNNNNNNNTVAPEAGAACSSSA